MSDLPRTHGAQRDVINVLHVDDTPDFVRTVTLNLETEADRFRVQSTTDPTDKQSQTFETGGTTNRRATGFGLASTERTVTANGWGVAVTDSPLGGPCFEITGVDLCAQTELDELPHQ